MHCFSEQRSQYFRKFEGKKQYHVSMLKIENLLNESLYGISLCTCVSM